MITKLLRLEEKQYYQSQIEANKHNIRRTWLVIKQAIYQKRSSSSGSDKFYDNGSDNGITNDPAVNANAFNNYFVNIGPILLSKIPEKGTQYRKYMPKGNEYSLFLLPATDKEVKNIIKQFKDGASGRDGITSLSLKLVSDDIAKPITRIVNLSFSQGVFPNELKISLVSPLYKAKDPMFFSNYRPISLLSTFSKILERLMYNTLSDFLDKYKILNKYQFGFKRKHSTYIALINLLENLTKALENEESAIGIFLDLSKSIWNCKPQYLIRQIVYLWHSRASSLMDYQLSFKPMSICGLQWLWIRTQIYQLWCTTRIYFRSALVFDLYQWFASCVQPFYAHIICWWHKPILYKSRMSTH